MDKAMRIVSVFIFLSIATITISLCNGNLGVPCKQNERQALLMFKQDLRDPSNRLLSWVGEGDCCNWTGVFCDNLTGHVRELHLGNYYSDEYLNYSLNQENSLGGKVNTSLLNLKHLSYLDLSNNDFGGIQIPSFLGSLKSLRYLNLSDSKFAGIIPHQLGNLSSLRSLGLRSKRNRDEYEIRFSNIHFAFGCKVESNNENQTLPSKEKCELTLEGAGSQEHSDKIAMLVDDEELELRELQGRPNALGCYDHFTTNGWRSCLFTLQRGTRVFNWFNCFKCITLFENISSSAYRMRINSSEKEVEESQSDIEDSGVVDDDLGDSGTCSSDDDSGCNSGNSKIKKLTYNMVTVYTEIDESHPGEDPINAIAEGIPSSLHSGSGAKIKGLSTKQHGMPRPTWVHAGYEWCKRILYINPIDSSGSISKFSDESLIVGTKGTSQCLM
ncbi:unnamed protein product [Prunus armeniaca]